MHRKDYVAVAGVLRGRRGDSTLCVEDFVDLIAHEFCGVFADDNDSFDAERFLSACGVRS